ncbi:MAG: ABC transporter permease [Synergistaceae bacterium]|jgi:peptide/nickel transport system permease protein|nr:ABC transporter permease [Synergistaceae bacterium]
MILYIGKRLLMMIPVVIGISLVVFLVMSLTPGDPARMILGEEAKQEEVDALRNKMGLNDPLFIQYGRYIFNGLHGDFGNSYRTKIPVFKEVISRFPTTLKVAVGAIILAVVLGIPLGILSSVRQYSLVDNISMVVSMVFTSIPTFWLGLMLLLVFSQFLGWLPSSGSATFKHFILPCIALSCNTFALLLRMTRSTMLEEIRQDYIRTTKAKGARPLRVIFKHALRNALLSIVTVIGLEFGSLLGGSVVTESVFGLPGLGTLIVTGVKQKDTPSVMAAVMFIAVTGGLINLFTDVLYTFIDPRLKARFSQIARTRIRKPLLLGDEKSG